MQVESKKPTKSNERSIINNHLANNHKNVTSPESQESEVINEEEEMEFDKQGSDAESYDWRTREEQRRSRIQSGIKI